MDMELKELDERIQQGELGLQELFDERVVGSSIVAIMLQLLELPSIILSTR